ncbi:MAG: DUF881 domain-containing protein [Candidatus Dormibacteraceae bacterium]
MIRSRIAASTMLAAVGLAFGFLLANQLKTELVPASSNRIGRYQALVATVQRLEVTNHDARARIAGLRRRIDQMEAAAARRSAAAQALRARVQDLRSHAGLTSLTGPGVTVTLVAGSPPTSHGASHPIGYQDVEDVVNLLFQGGAEGVAVNGHRMTSVSVLRGSGGQVVVDQSSPLKPPFEIAAVGDRDQMEALLADPSTLGEVRYRQQADGLRLSWTGSASNTLPASESNSLEVRYARPA